MNWHCWVKSVQAHTHRGTETYTQMSTHTYRRTHTCTHKTQGQYANTNSAIQPCSAEVADLVLAHSLTHTPRSGLVSLGRKIADPVFTHTHICTHTLIHTQAQLVICRDISEGLLTLSSSIFQGLAALTTICHFNTRPASLLHRLSRHCFPPLPQSPSSLLLFSQKLDFAPVSQVAARF